MGLFGWLLQLFGWGSSRPSPKPDHSTERAPSRTDSQVVTSTPPTSPRVKRPAKVWTGRVRLTKRTRMKQSKVGGRGMPYVETKGAAPYRYARYGSQTGHYLDLSQDGDENQLARLGLPVFQTPEELATWLGLPINKVAWLVHRFSAGRPSSDLDAHYHFHWVKKHRGGWRLIEAPKTTLKNVQTKILRDLLDKIPVHASAHGFTSGRSILTNAIPHVGHPILVKFDLTNFYTTVSFARVVAIFRQLGYSREVSIWLGLLTTSAVPGNLSFQEQGPYALTPYLRRHLPQGAPTSPALANLSAFGLDVRLTGLARAFGATYTRYADDIAISGPLELGHGLKTVIPLVQQIVRQERFYVNKLKRRVLRANQRQTVTGIVVNEKTNVSRTDYDQLKAILTNCLRHGPSTQNRFQADSFFHHLQGCIAYVNMLNPARGAKLKALFARIDWNR